MRSFILWERTLLRGSHWTSGRFWNSVVINIDWVWLPPCQWPKVGLSAAKWLIKEVWTNFTFFFLIFIAVFDKEEIINISINSVSRPISTHDYNSTNQAIAMGRYQSDFRKIVNFFSGKQNLFSSYLRFDLLFLLIKDFQNSYIIFDTEKSYQISSKASVFSFTWSKLWSVILQFSQNRLRPKCFLSFLKNVFKYA